MVITTREGASENHSATANAVLIVAPQIACDCLLGKRGRESAIRDVVNRTDEPGRVATRFRGDESGDDLAEPSVLLEVDRLHGTVSRTVDRPRPR